jgi:hypothetical protein
VERWGQGLGAVELGGVEVDAGGGVLAAGATAGCVPAAGVDGWGRGGMGRAAALGDDFDVEDQRGLGGDDGRTSGFSVGELVGDDEAALAADAHAFKAGVPALDDAVLAVLEVDGLLVGVVVGGVEFFAVGEVAGVLDAEVGGGTDELAGAGCGVDVEQREALGLLVDAVADLGADQRRDVVELHLRGVGDGVEGLGAGS